MQKIMPQVIENTPIKETDEVVGIESSDFEDVR
jgi:hypothetical protein